MIECEFCYINRNAPVPSSLVFRGFPSATVVVNMSPSHVTYAPPSGVPTRCPHYLSARRLRVISVNGTDETSDHLALANLPQLTWPEGNCIEL